MLLMGIGVGESPLNSVQLLRENISHKQTLTKKLAMKIFVFLSRFLYAKISFKVFRQFTQEPQIFQHKNSICFTLVSMEYKNQPSKFIFHSLRGIQILILGNATFQFLGNCEYMRDKSEGNTCFEQIVNSVFM